MCSSRDFTKRFHSPLIIPVSWMRKLILWQWKKDCPTQVTHVTAIYGQALAGFHVTLSSELLGMMKTWVTSTPLLRAMGLWWGALPSLSVCAFIFRLEVFIPGRIGVHAVCELLYLVDILWKSFVKSQKVSFLHLFVCSALGWLSCYTPSHSHWPTDTRSIGCKTH